MCTDVSMRLCYALQECLREIEEERVRQEAIRRAEEAYKAKLLDQQRRMEEAQTRIRAEEEKRRRIPRKAAADQPMPSRVQLVSMWWRMEV